MASKSSCPVARLSILPWEPRVLLGVRENVTHRLRKSCVDSNLVVYHRGPFTRRYPCSTAKYSCLPSLPL
jgi:hypothetical protein